MIDKSIIGPFSVSQVALDRYPGPGYTTLLLRLILGYHLTACPHRQFHTLPGHLDSCMCEGGSLYRYFMMVFGITRPWRESATYHITGRHANHYVNPTR